MFNKMNIYFTVAVFSLLAISYITYHFKEYYSNLDKDKNDKDKQHKSIVKYLSLAIKSLMLLVVSIILTGFTLYFFKQRKDYSNNFSFLTFIFGKNKMCKLKIICNLNNILQYIKTKNTTGLTLVLTICPILWGASSWLR